MDKNPCYDRPPFKDTVQVQDGWHYPRYGLRTREPIMVTIPNRNTTDCQYSKSTPDPKCDGCKWKSP